MPKNPLRWDDLRVFLAVARHGRPAEAARAEGLESATVARRLAALEAATGARLFERGLLRYELTEAGRHLLLHAEAMESAAAAALGAAADDQPLSGVVRIGAPDGVSNYLLAGACDKLTRDNPGLQVQVVALPRVFSFSKREADLAITNAPPSAGRLTVRKIADYRLRLYGRADLIESLGEVRSMDDLEGLRGIGYISDLVFDKELDYYALLGRSEEPALTSNSLIVQLRWCLAGCGLCILPDFVAREHPELRAALPRDIRLLRAFYLVRHQDDARTARINRLAEVVADWLRKALEETPARA